MRRAMAGLPLLLALRPAHAALPHEAAVAAMLARTLPPALDARSIGRALRAAHPACTTADCRARAALADLAALPTATTADFATGATVTVDGWVLSRTEAWLCAALA